MATPNQFVSFSFRMCIKSSQFSCSECDFSKTVFLRCFADGIEIIRKNIFTNSSFSVAFCGSNMYFELMVRIVENVNFFRNCV